jgi:hypothetical protein
MHAALLLCTAGFLLGCAPRADQVFSSPGSLTTGSSGTQPGYGAKLVRAKHVPTDVIGDDGSVCRLTEDRFAEVDVGDWVACSWMIVPDTIAAATRAGA